MICRILAWALLCVAISVFGAEILVYLESGNYVPLSLGQIWQSVSMKSYVQAEDIVHLRIWPPLWDHGIERVLRLPAWALLAVLSMIFFIKAKRQPR